MAADTLLTAVRAHLNLDPDHSVILEPIKRGASGRTIVRLKAEGHPTFIGIHYTLDRRDNRYFLPVARFLKKAKLNVPEVLYDNPGRNIALVEDLGEVDLLSIVDKPWEEREPYYRCALEQLDRLFYTRPPKDLELSPAFTAETYQWEQEYFIDNLVETHLGLDGAALRNDPHLVKLRENLGSSHRNLVHRDFQSQNIILYEGKSWLIDFQGLRLGRQEYDLASLLYDPYLNHTEEEQDKLLDLWEDIGEERPVPDLLRDCAIQRLMQALGAYANILHNQKIDWYAQHIPTGAKLLLTQVQDTPLQAVLGPVLEKAAAD
ncbi:MAG: phosphotransferase [Roseibacillus sp.]|jgi:aminoglycoside/choline kinase family phosphotransferase